MDNETIARLASEFENSSFYKNLFLPWLEERKQFYFDEGVKILEKDGTKSKLSIISGKYRFIEELKEKISEWKREFPKSNQNQRQG